MTTEIHDDHQPSQPGAVLSSEGLGAGAEARTALERFKECGGQEEPDPVERLRFFCSLAMCGQDWLDVESLFDAVIADRATAVAAERERCALIARNGCLVPPDGGSPTDDERLLCEEIERRIRGA